MRYGVSVGEIGRAMSAAFDDIRSADFHKDVRATLISKTVQNIEAIEDWMQKLQPKYKRYQQQLDIHGNKQDLWAETDDHTAFIKFQAELRQQHAILRQLLGAELPEETDKTKENIQRKMMDALTLSLQIVKGNQDSMQPASKSIIDIDRESIIETDTDEE